MDEHIDVTLSPEEVAKYSEELEVEYSRQSDEVRERYDKQFERLVERWGNKEMAKELFDSFSFTGALKLSAREYNGLSDSPLKKFIDTESANYEGRERYSLEYGGEIYLRAEAYYQFYDRKQTPQERCRLSTESLVDLTGRLDEIQDHAGSKDNLDLTEVKIYLAYLDHLKAELLRLFHAQVNLRVKNGESGDSQESSVRLALESVSKVYYTILDGGAIGRIRLDKEGIFDEVEMIKDEIDERSTKGKSLDGVMRGLPESDNPLHNKIYAIGVADRIQDIDSKDITLAAMHFGGVELPWAIAEELSFRKKEIPEILTVHYSRYTNRNDAPQDFWNIVDHKTDRNKKLLLLDDGVYSGESLKVVRDLAMEAGYGDVKVSVQKLANSRQMGRMLITGGVNPDFVDEQLVDAIGVSPFFRTQVPEDYTELKKRGHFNIVAERVKRMLINTYINQKPEGTDLFGNLTDKLR